MCNVTKFSNNENKLSSTCPIVNTLKSELVLKICTHLYPNVEGYGSVSYMIAIFVSKFHDAEIPSCSLRIV